MAPAVETGAPWLGTGSRDGRACVQGTGSRDGCEGGLTTGAPWMATGSRDGCACVQGIGSRGRENIPSRLSSLRSRTYTHFLPAHPTHSLHRSTSRPSLHHHDLLSALRLWVLPSPRGQCQHRPPFLFDGSGARWLFFGVAFPPPRGQLQQRGRALVSYGPPRGDQRHHHCRPPSRSAGQGPVPSSGQAPCGGGGCPGGSGGKALARGLGGFGASRGTGGGANAGVPWPRLLADAYATCGREGCRAALPAATAGPAVS